MIVFLLFPALIYYIHVDKGSRASTQDRENRLNSSPRAPSTNPIHVFLRQNNFSDNTDFGVKDEVMDTFVLSCAGYSVITYILGVGDRHLDNLMLMPSGEYNSHSHSHTHFFPHDLCPFLCPCLISMDCSISIFLAPSLYLILSIYNAISYCRSLFPCRLRLPIRP